MNKKTLNMEL